MLRELAVRVAVNEFEGPPPLQVAPGLENHVGPVEGLDLELAGRALQVVDLRVELGVRAPVDDLGLGVLRDHAAERVVGLHVEVIGRRHARALPDLDPATRLDDGEDLAGEAIDLERLIPVVADDHALADQWDAVVELVVDGDAEPLKRVVSDSVRDGGLVDVSPGLHGL